ncbi:MAG: acyl-CoA dehydrogenase [Chloroflexi bacterium]|nr:acyl-CoA dehydrogenase [Chloroflexota bacterium]
MDFGLSEQQTLIRDGARAFLRERCTSAYVRAMQLHPIGCPDEVWRELAEMGWTGMLVPEEFGGAGLGLVELGLVLEEMGVAAFPGPFFSTAVVGASALILGGDEAQKSAYLSRIAGGSLKISLAAQEEDPRWGPHAVKCTAVRTGEGWSLSGAKLFVADAASAGLFVVAARGGRPAAADAAVTLFLVPADASGLRTGQRWRTAAHDYQSSLTFENVRLDLDAVLGSVGGGWPVLRRLLLIGAAAKAAEMVGGASRMLDMTADYARKREQFGKPIGGFQAVAHMVAEMAIQVESARNLAFQALWRLANGRDAESHVALAKVWANEACVRTAELAHQTHGAIGFTQEHDLQLFSRRALAGRVTFGDARDHRDAALASIGL